MHFPLPLARFSHKLREQGHDERFRTTPRSYSPTGESGLSNKRTQKVSKGSRKSVPIVLLLLLIEKQRLQRFLVLLSATSARSTPRGKGPVEKERGSAFTNVEVSILIPPLSKDRGRLPGQTVNMRRLLKSRENRITCLDSISSASFCNLARISFEISGLGNQSVKVGAFHGRPLLSR